MQKIFLGLILFISPFFLLAHNPLSAIYRLQTNSNGGVLDISLTQAGVNKALIDAHGADFVNTLSPQKFKELIVSYIKDNFNLSINNTKIELTNGGIRYGNHQTDLTFITSTISEKIDHIDVQIKAFQNNEFHQTVFFYNRNGKNEKIVLNQKNNFKSEINFEEPKNDEYSKIIWITLSLLGFGLLIFLLKSKKIIFN